MAKCDMKEPRETLRGTGACDIRYEVLRRSGKPNWWCRTHGMDAAAPDGNAVEACAGSWFNPVPPELQLDLDLDRELVAVWGVVPPGIVIGEGAVESGKVHVHRRQADDGAKDIDASYDIVRLHRGERTLTVEGIAAVAYSVSELSGRAVKMLECPRCGERHIDEHMFATHAHKKHLCNACGRDFWDMSGPSVSNPLADAQGQLGLAAPPEPVRPDRPLDLVTDDYTAVLVWPSNTAIVSTMTRPEEIGFHVHAWDRAGQRSIDETYSALSINGVGIGETELRALTVQRMLAIQHGTPIVSLSCHNCGIPLISPTSGWVQPTTTHVCDACGATTKTRHKVFVNPLAGAPWSS